MTLKDCSVYNIQFHQGRPIFIDTLSFEIYRDGEPWIGYRQFCEHFLAPLALAKPDRSSSQPALPDEHRWSSSRSGRATLAVEVAAALWAGGAHSPSFRPATVPRGGSRPDPRVASLNRRALLGLVDSLQSTVRGLRWKPRGKGWATYYDENSYTPEEFQRKARLVAEFLKRTGSNSVWDLGANTGYFSHARVGAGPARRSPLTLIRLASSEPTSTVKERKRNKASAAGPGPLQSQPPLGLAEPGAVLDLRPRKARPCPGAGTRSSPGFHRQSTPGKSGGLL